jgi:hypothetical protein
MQSLSLLCDLNNSFTIQIISNSQFELLSLNLFRKDLTQSTRRSRGRKEFLIFLYFIDERSEIAPCLHGHDRASEETKGLIPCGLPQKTAAGGGCRACPAVLIPFIRFTRKFGVKQLNLRTTAPCPLRLCERSSGVDLYKYWYSKSKCRNPVQIIYTT